MYSTAGLYLMHDPSTTMSTPEIEHWIGVASAAIDAQIGRSLADRVVFQTAPGTGDNIMLLDATPVTALYYASHSPERYASIHIPSPVPGLTLSLTNSISLSGSLPVIAVTTSIAVFGSGAADTTTYLSTGDETVEDMIDDIVASLAALGVTATVSRSPWTSSKAAYMLGMQTSTGHGVWDLMGAQPYAPAWQLEDSRTLVFEYASRSALREKFCWYRGGYVLPSGLDYGTLPKDVVDITNALVRQLSVVATTAGGNVVSEKLGNAEVKYGSIGAIDRTASGFLLSHSAVLDRYKHKDIWI